MSEDPDYPFNELGLPEKGVRLLSLDGGGIKGISTLIILDAIMTKVKELEIANDINPSDDERLPKDYFELAAGTSTGGLIALMLFRLDMSVSQTTHEYREMAGKVFSPTAFGFQLHKLGVVGDWLGRAVLLFKTVFEKAQFSDKPLIATIEEVVRKYGVDKIDHDKGGDAPLKHPNPDSGGKMIMCSTLCDKGECILLRSYDTPEDAIPISTDAKAAAEGNGLAKIPITIAARATSAAPTYLPQVEWEKMEFWDGGLLNNNPINQLWDNRYDLVKQGHPAPKVSVVLSLGTSWSDPKKPGLLRLVNVLGKATSFMTNVEAKNRDFARYLNRARGRVDANRNTRYYRFNTPTKEVEIALHEYLKMGQLEDFTKTFLADEETKKDIENCAKLLVGMHVPREEFSAAQKMEAD